MVEARRLPCTGVVTHLAGLREPSRHVIRIGRTLEIFQVARHAGRARQAVVVVHVAIGTLSRGNRMRPGQCKVDQRVIERCRLPCDRRVALRTIRRKVRGHVVRIRGALEILQVAANAGRARQVVVVVDVTVDALARWHCVSTVKRKSNRVVVEGRVQPAIRSMAIRACCREPGLRVIRIRRRLEFVQVTRDALG